MGEDGYEGGRRDESRWAKMQIFSEIFGLFLEFLQSSLKRVFATWR